MGGKAYFKMQNDKWGDIVRPGVVKQLGRKSVMTNDENGNRLKLMD